MAVSKWRERAATWNWTEMGRGGQLPTRKDTLPGLVEVDGCWKMRSHEFIFIVENIVF
jgi:hypothetical protein